MSLRENAGLSAHSCLPNRRPPTLRFAGDFDPALLKVAFTTDPEKYTILLNAYTRVLGACQNLSQAEFNLRAPPG